MKKDKAYGKRISDWLKIKGISPTEGAVRIGISYTYLSQIISGRPPGKFLKEKINKLLEE